MQRSEQQLETLRESAKKHVEDFEKARAGFTWSADISMPATPAPPDIEALETWLAGAAHLPAEWKKAETVRQDKKQFIGALKRALKTYSENVQAQKELDTLLPKLNRAHWKSSKRNAAFSPTTSSPKSPAKSGASMNSFIRARG